MKRNVVSVEENLLAKREKINVERIVTIKEEPSSPSSYVKIDTLKQWKWWWKEWFWLTRLHQENLKEVHRPKILTLEGILPRLNKEIKESR